MMNNVHRKDIFQLEINPSEDWFTLKERVRNTSS